MQSKWNKWAYERCAAELADVSPLKI